MNYLDNSTALLIANIWTFFVIFLMVISACHFLKRFFKKLTKT